MPVDGHEFGSAAATERLLVTREDLERDAREIRERGYALSWEDVTAHACALGVPVYDEASQNRGYRGAPSGCGCLRRVLSLPGRTSMA